MPLVAIHSRVLRGIQVSAHLAPKLHHRSIRGPAPRSRSRRAFRRTCTYRPTGASSPTAPSDPRSTRSATRALVLFRVFSIRDVIAVDSTVRRCAPTSLFRATQPVRHQVAFVVQVRAITRSSNGRAGTCSASRFIIRSKTGKFAALALRSRLRPHYSPLCSISFAHQSGPSGLVARANARPLSP
jgi:hypothetical protein